MMKKTRKLLALITCVGIICTTMLFNIVPAQAVTIKAVAEGTYVFYSKLGGDMVMDVYDASKKPGANVQLWKYNGSSAQQFEVKKSGDWYTIRPVCSGLALDVKGGSKESGANVQQYTPNNTDSQKWQFYDAGNGYYYLRSKVGSKALDVKGGKKTNGTNIQVYNPSSNNDSQQWKLKKVSKTLEPASQISLKTTSKHTTGQAGINLIKSYEGCRLTAYKAVSSEKYYTIGYGHYGSDVKKGKTITKEKAEQLLKKDLVKYENYVNSFLTKNKIAVNQNQFDALVSFTYNVGNVWAKQNFSLKQYLISGKYTDEQITKAFTNWNKSGGKVLSGLTKRRKAEAALFLK